MGCDDVSILYSILVALCRQRKFQNTWMRMFTERSVRRALIAIALAGLVSGAVAWANGRSDLAGCCWAAATLAVLMGLLIPTIREFLTGRVGVNSVTFVSTSGALFL